VRSPWRGTTTRFRCRGPVSRTSPLTRHPTR
jgi:hypothetical protein